eukprot:2767585-Rhodomonas_salina.3
MSNSIHSGRANVGDGRVNPQQQSVSFRQLFSKRWRTIELEISTLCGTPRSGFWSLTFML